MKKFGQIVLVFLLSVGMFTGCGTSTKRMKAQFLY